MSLEYVFILTCYCKSEAHTMRFQPVKLISSLYRLQAVVHACMKAHATVHYILGVLHSVCARELQQSVW